MHPLEVEDAMNKAVLLVDTREHAGTKLDKRIEQTELSFERKKLNYGDYSIKVMLQDNREISFEKEFAIERKMSLDELAICLTSNRDRFTREFKRAKEDNALLYLLCENGSLNMIEKHQYRSRMHPKAFMASLFTFIARYGCHLIFCPEEMSGRMIKQIMEKELKERLLRFDE